MVSFKRRVLLVVGAGLTVVAVSGAMVGSASAKSGGGALRVEIVDDCNPATFNANVPAPPGQKACVGRGETTFKEFIAELTAERSVDDWAFDPDSDSVRPGQMVTAANRGGETHSFTCVKQFGRGVVDILNRLSGLGSGPPTAVCTGEDLGASFVPAGQSRTVSLSQFTVPNGTYRFQCMIHPWMKTTLKVEHK